MGIEDSELAVDIDIVVERIDSGSVAAAAAAAAAVVVVAAVAAVAVAVGAVEGKDCS